MPKLLSLVQQANRDHLLRRRMVKKTHQAGNRNRPDWSPRHATVPGVWWCGTCKVRHSPATTICGLVVVVYYDRETGMRRDKRCANTAPWLYKAA